MVAAQQRALIAKKTRTDRAGSTIQETVAYFVSDNQALLIGVGIITALVGLGGLIAIFVAPQNQSVVPQPSPAAAASQLDQSEISVRQSYAKVMQQDYEKQYSGVRVTTSGPKSQTLVISSSAITTKFIDAFRQKKNFDDLKRIGFTDARIEGVGKQEWRLSF